MGAVFGGSSSVETFLGTKTITVLWKATVVCGCLFIGLAILLNIISTGSSSNSGAFDNQPASEQSVPAGSGTDDSSGESGGSVPSGDGTESGSDANQQ